MKIAIIFESKTGNTANVADAVRRGCSAAEITAFGGPELMEDMKADLVFAGSWTDKGNCDEKMGAFLKNLHHTDLAVFGTTGFGGSEEYYDRIFGRARELIDEDNCILGHFYCQGKMGLAVRDRYVSLFTEHPEDKNLAVSIQNFDEALSHPDENDLKRAEEFAKGIIKLAAGE